MLREVSIELLELFRRKKVTLVSEFSCTQAQPLSYDFSFG
jgi:hypothetical protein